MSTMEEDTKNNLMSCCPLSGIPKKWGLTLRCSECCMLIEIGPLSLWVDEQWKADNSKAPEQ